MQARHIYLHATVWKRYWVHLWMCVCECDPAGFRSKQSSLKWLVHNLIDRQTPFSLSVFSPLPRRLSSVFILYYRSLLLCTFLFLLHPLTSPPLNPLFNDMFVLPSPSLLSILPPSCLTLDDINTSFLLRRDRITCGNAAHNRSTSAIWKCMCVSACVLISSSIQICIKKKYDQSEWSKKTFHSVMVALWWPCFIWNYYSHIRVVWSGRLMLFSADMLHQYRDII